MMDEDEQHHLYEQAHADGQEALSDLAEREAKHFQSHLESEESQTAVAWAAAARLNAVASLWDRVTAILGVACALGVVEATLLIAKNW